MRQLKLFEALNEHTDCFMSGDEAYPDDSNIVYENWQMIEMVAESLGHEAVKHLGVDDE